ncbi:MAG: DUF6273 domain-containing protein [Oscillospiraceae bacterium]|nr:DUF6273 domain-containing protein [Oscillospiraceae bacterium]
MKKALSLLLAAALALGLLALAPLTASAAGVPAVGDKVYFGQYPQSAYTPASSLGAASGTVYTDTNGTKCVYQGGSYFKFEPVEWRVLSNAGGELFLLAEKNLDAGKPYNTTDTAITWENCTLRKFLNGTTGNPHAYNFIGWAFTAAEQAVIKTTAVANPNNTTYGTNGGNATNDKIFLLSIGEAESLMNDASRVAVNTAYTAKFYGMAGAGSADRWRLRSTGLYQGWVSEVGTGGYVDSSGSGADNAERAVRPALKLDLSSVSFTTDGSGKTLVTLATTTPPTITGPTALSLTAGYAAQSTGVYTVTGTAPVTVTKTSGDAKITWNDTTKKLDIAAGLAAGSYPVVLKAANGATPDATITFTLTVSPAIVTTYPVTVNNGAGSNSYAAGATVNITADAAPSGQVFDRWTATGVTLSNPTSASASFTMPANAVTLTATYKDNGSSNAWTIWDWILYIFFFGWLWM